MRLEQDLYRAVDRALPKYVPKPRSGIHRQSMTGTSFGGTVDRYYDGTVRDLWAEYKMLASEPKAGVIKGAYTPLQLDWMMRRWNTGGNVIGVVGVRGKGAVIQTEPEEWLHGTSQPRYLTPREVAEWIIAYCGA